MNVILFGATGMVGAGTLREALADPGVERVLSVVQGRTDRYILESADINRIGR